MAWWNTNEQALQPHTRMHACQRTHVIFAILHQRAQGLPDGILGNDEANAGRFLPCKGIRTYPPSRPQRKRARILGIGITHKQARRQHRAKLSWRTAFGCARHRILQGEGVDLQYSFTNLELILVDVKHPGAGLAIV